MDREGTGVEPVDRGAGPGKASARKRPGMTRRNLCIGIGGMAACLGLGAFGSLGLRSMVRPPGGQDQERLLSACIRCEKCYEVCPEDVIRPVHLEDGIANARTPALSFSDRWCTWCADQEGGYPLCVQACPTGALALDEGATPRSTVLGLAQINEDWCLAYRLIGCRFCYDACPYNAMELDAEGRPVVIAERCNGCGACEAVCVSLQNGSISQGADARAITVRPL